MTLNTLNNQTRTSTATKTKGSNPFINSVEKEQNTDGTRASFQGVIAKGIVFVISIVIGAMIEIFLNALPMQQIVNSDGMTANAAQLIGILSASILVFAAPIIGFFAKRTIPVTGSIFCASVGFMHTALADVLVKYRSGILLALVVTVSVFAAINLVYRTGIIKVNRKFSSVVTVLFATFVIASLFIAVCSFIPAFSGVTALVFASPLVSISLSVLGIVVAVLFIFTDLDKIHKNIENGVSAKSEWTMAFSIVFSVIWLFMQIVSLIMNIVDFK